MQRIAKWLIVLGALGVVGWIILRTLSGDPIAPAITIALDDPIPDTPDEWHGKIDYRGLDQQLAVLASRPEMAGLAVAVVEDGELTFVRTYGVADRSTGAAVTPQTVFRWASVSKTATGILAASLASEGRLDLDRPVASWPGSLRLPEGAEARLTVAQLLSQRTGLTKNAYDEKLEDGESPGSLRLRLAAAPLQCPPATCHTYQNVAFDAASEILAQAAKQPFDEAVSARFFRPLGMKSAHYGMAGLIEAKDWARPHHYQEVRAVKEAYWRVPAAAGVDSNIVDFAKWMQAMMGVRPNTVSAAALKIAQAPRVATPRLYSGVLAQALSEPGYGLGWRSFAYGGSRLVGHSGAVAGYRATMIFEPATRTGVVAMWNSNWGIPFRIPFAVFDSAHQRSASPWLDLTDVPLPVPEPGSLPGLPTEGP